MLLGLLAFVGGAALQLQQPQLWSSSVYAGFGLIAGVFIAWAAIKNIAFASVWELDVTRHWHRLALAVAALVLGFCMAGLQASARAQQGLASELEGRDVDVVGVVSTMPQPFAQGLRFRLSVESAQVGNQAVSLPPLLNLSWYNTGARGHAANADDGWQLGAQPQALGAGERWRMRLRLKAPHGGLNPHGFDYELWLWEQGVGASGYVRAAPTDPSPTRLASTWQYPVEQARQTVRERIMQRVTEPQAAGVLAALTLGDQAAIERADWDVFRATGVAHLVSISGLHITLFAWVAVRLIGALWRRSARWGWRLCLVAPAPLAAHIGGLALALAYALFSGWAVPAQRTVWMLAAATLIRVLGLRWHWGRVWALACAVVVAMDPWALLSAGFWLSFVAVGVLFASAPRDRTEDIDATKDIAGYAVNTPASARFGLKNASQWLLGLVRLLPHSGVNLSAFKASFVRAGLVGAARMLREQTLITFALAPLGLVLFGQLSVVGFVANLLAIPWVTLLVTPLALLGIVFAPLWQLAAWALQTMVQALQVLAALPWASLSVPSAPAPVAAFALLGAGLAVAPLPRLLRAGGLLMAAPLLLYTPPRPAHGQFDLLAADVGQGNAVLLRTASHSLLYDAGPRYSSESDAGQRSLVPLLRALGERLDTVVLSHRDSDHTGGAVAVLQMQSQARLLASLEPGHELNALRPVQPCRAGQRWAWDGVDFEVLHPGDEASNPRAKPNTLSCVLRVSNGQQSALLLGDIEVAQEAQLLARLSASELRAQWLLAPHHGSKSSSSPAFVQATQPRFVVVQSGYRNRFAHPAPEVAARWQAVGAQVVDSPHCGAATWRSSTPDAMHCERAASKRYWRHHPP